MKGTPMILDNAGQINQRIPALIRRSPVSFQCMTPGLLADWLIGTHGFREQIPMASEVYRLTAEQMVITIFSYGLVLTEGHNATAAALLLADLCEQEGGQA